MHSGVIMTSKGSDCMVSISALKKRLSDNNTLIVQNEDGNISEAGFIWNFPVTLEEIQSFEKNNKIELPIEYIEFLQISNGAILFKDMEYGQWGCKILGLNEILAVTNELKQYGLQLKPFYIPFATWLGDGDVLLFSMDKYKTDRKNYIIDGDEGYRADEWEYINGNFKKWLDRLIVAQGAKYWRWY